MRVIGTAGHVDHGKSTLVQALTGMNPDRLQEEQARQMTIDLGFTWLTLPNGEVVSIVDVPGHEDFIRNMLAGVGALDLALLVVAADESIMPQSREHLQILDLLDVPQGVVALTKSDLAEDEEWLELVELEIAEVLEGTALAEAPVVRVSARTGEGLDTLVATLQNALRQSAPRVDMGRPRLSVDRVFTVTGFGTVVTGTLLDGTFAVGEEVELLPVGRRGRIRSLQTNREQVERATPGRRLAVNVAGVEVAEVQRGDVLAHPGDYRATRLIDVHLRLLEDAAQPLRHNQEIDLFHGAAERIGHLRLIGTKELAPGQESFAQIRLREPMLITRGDRFVLRQLSPSRTLGGGHVLDPHPRARWRRFRPDTLSRFERLAAGSPTDLLQEALNMLEPTTVSTLFDSLALPTDEAHTALDESVAEGRVQQLPDGTLFTALGWARRAAHLERMLVDYHEAYPLRAGLPREELAQRLGLPQRVALAFAEALQAEGRLQLGEGWLARPGWEVTLSATQKRRVDALLAAFAAAPFSPPNPGEALALLEGDEALLAHLVDRGDIIRLSPDVLLSRDAYDRMVEGVRALHAEGRDLSVATVRDHFDTSRKYAVALLEYLDTQRVTRRIGDRRVLR